ncbi:MAG: hypothetical protein GXW85_08775 [Clostridia bacterium]|nr:hypothetical protein [Clostridia bacterium]
MSENGRKVVSILITIVSLIFVIFHLYTGYFGSLEVVKQRAIHLLFGLTLLYLISLKNSQKTGEKIINLVALMGVIGAIGYFFIRFEWIAVQRFPYVTPLSLLEKCLGLLMILLVIEAVRRKVGNVLVYVVLFFLSYPFI